VRLPVGVRQIEDVQHGILIGNHEPTGRLVAVGDLEGREQSRLLMARPPGLSAFSSKS
jgi:hypothetical protein